MADDTHTTLGRTFRFPAHPEVVAALGRALYCFLAIEDIVSSMLYESGIWELQAVRGRPAGEKEDALRGLAKRYRKAGDNATADLILRGADAFRAIREDERNQLLHAHPFTAGEDVAGAYLPGLAYTERDGSAWTEIARTPADLLDLAHRIEGAIDPLSGAREAVNASPLVARPPT